MISRLGRFVIVVAALLPAISHADPEFQSLANFDNPPQNPGVGRLAAGTGGYFWGATPAGGAHNAGTIYKVKADGSERVTVFSFGDPLTASVGRFPEAELISASGFLWGTTERGGVLDLGTIFKVDQATGVVTTVKYFTGDVGFLPGSYPKGRLVNYDVFSIVGTASAGGATNHGTVFKINKSDGAATILVEFTGTGGANPGSAPTSGLTLSTDPIYWGTTSAGGTADKGTVYSVSLASGSSFTSVVQFSGNGASNKGSAPLGALVSDGAGSFWGTTSTGGAGNLGTVFKVAVSGGALTTMAQFTGNGASSKGGNPHCDLASDGAGSFWGTTATGGANNLGTVFSINASTGAITTQAEFTGDGASNRGSSPYAGLVSDGAGSFLGTTRTGGWGNSGTVFKINTTTSALTTPIEFQNTNSADRNPAAGLAADGLGFLWGTTEHGGTLAQGTVFKIQEFTNTVTTMVEFTGITGSRKGSSPKSTLVRDNSGTMWGTTYLGGANDLGTIFKINPSTGAFTTVVEFANDGVTNWGAKPVAGMVLDASGDLWGTAERGGSSNVGLVFKIRPSTGVLTRVAEFSDIGAHPVAGLTSDGAGSFWGTTVGGGTGGYGSVFKVNATTGVLTTVVDFTSNGTSNKGAAPYATLLNDGGFMWGTTSAGGTSGYGTIFKVSISGGFFTTVRQFDLFQQSTAGWGLTPYAGFVAIGTDTLWSTTYAGGTNGLGSVYSLFKTGSGILPQVACNDSEGSRPAYGSLLLHTDGNVYGTTQFGGSLGGGTVFRFHFGPTPNAAAASSMTRYSATLNGGANPRGRATTAFFEWGASPTLLDHSTNVQSLGSGSSDVAISSIITGLLPGTTYYYRVSSTNAEALAAQRSAVLSFTTAPGNTDATLSALSLSGGTLDPTFASGSTSYTATVSNTTASITLTPTVSTSTSTVKVNNVAVTSGSASGSLPLAFGPNTITVLVTAEDQAVTQTYTVVVTRTPLPEIAVENSTGGNLTDGTSSVIYSTLVLGTSETRSFTIKNSGTTALNISGVQTTGGSNADFVVNTTGMSTTIAIGASTTFTVTFSPGASTARSSTLQIFSDDTDEATFDINLTGTGIPVVTGSLNFASATALAREGDGVDLTILRTGGSIGEMWVQVFTFDGTAVVNYDYIGVAPVVVFGDGVTSRTIHVPVNADGVREAVEKFDVILTNYTGKRTSLGAISTVTVSIADTTDKALPTLTVSSPVANGQVAEGSHLHGTTASRKGLLNVQTSLNGAAFSDAVTYPSYDTSATFDLPLAFVPGTNTLAVRSTDVSGVFSKVLTRTFTYVVMRPLSVAVTGPTNAGTITTGFLGTTDRQLAKSYSITATSKLGFVFNGWTATNITNTGITAAMLELPTLSFIMQPGLTLSADFIANPFTAVAGTYNGLLHADAALPAPNGTPSSLSTEGSFTATVEPTGEFTGRITLDAQSLSVDGVFDNTGTARFGLARASTLNLSRLGKSPITVALHLDLATPGVDDKITGTVSQKFRDEVTAISNIDADLAFYNGLTPATTVPDAYLTIAGSKKSNGIFTSFIKPLPLASQPAGFTLADYPQGEGYATITVTKAGALIISGALADGTKLTASGTLSKGNTCPLFAQLYNKLGFLSGQMVLNSLDAGSDMKCLSLLWSRPYQSTQHYPFGWPEVIKADWLGARYSTTPNVASLKAPGGLALPSADADGNARLTLEDGLLGGPFARSVNVSAADAVAKLPTTDATFSLGVTRTSGLMTGSFNHTDGTRPSFNGLLYQKGSEAGGHGYFLTTSPKVINQTGQGGRARLFAQ